MSTAADNQPKHRVPARAVPRWPIVMPVALLLAAVGMWAGYRPLDRPGGSLAHSGYRVDLNHADAAELSLLPGIGPRIAQRVVAYRDEHGPFADFEQVKNVHGLGDRTVARIMPYAMLGASDDADALSALPLP